MEDTESLDQICPEDTNSPLSLFDELNIKSEPGNLLLESLLDLGESSSCMDNPLFEQFMDLDQLFPELPLLDTLNLEFEVEQTSQVAASDIHQSDVVTMGTGSSSGEYVEVSSPRSEVIDVVSLDDDAEVPLSTDDLSDVALSPESVVDVTSVEEDPASLAASVYHIILDSDQAEHPSEEITVIQTSDALTPLQQELMQSSSHASDVLMTSSEEQQLVEHSESLSSMTVDLDELFSFPHLLGLANNVVTPSVDDACSSSSESVASLSENSVKTPCKQKRKSTCSSECSSSPSKKVKCDNSSKKSKADILDKQTVRRMKNNVASKHARAARKQKEQELFQQEEELTKSNAELRKQLAELEKLATTMRKVLVEKLSGVTCPV